MNDLIEIIREQIKYLQEDTCNVKYTFSHDVLMSKLKELEDQLKELTNE